MTRLLILCSLLLSVGAFSAVPMRVISLAPHTTEWMYALGAGERLIAASDFSDYPAAATSLPRVASYNGVNFEAIIKLQPDLILGWQGGNKAQDLARLQSLGFKLFLSDPKQPEQISTEMRELAQRLGLPAQQPVLDEFDTNLASLRQQYQRAKPMPVFYYMWTQPLMSIGAHAWGNQILQICGARTLFADALTDYPEVTLESVLLRQPQRLIAVMKTSQREQDEFWSRWHSSLAASQRPVLVLDPDLLHRFTPRLLTAVNQLCSQLHEAN